MVRMNRPTLLASPAAGQDRSRLARLPRWVRVLAGGALLWGLAAAVLLATGDRYVTGAVVLGTFVVPLAFCFKLVEGEDLPGTELQLLVRLFVFGGVLGFLASAFLEHPLGSQPAVVFDGWVGLVEETSKLAALAFMTRNFVGRTPRSGFVLGGLVGFGFAAFESAGYAVASAVGPGTDSHVLIDTVLTRAVTAPFTHGLWSAVAGAALFASSRNGRFRPAPLALAALAGVAVLHAGWDLMPYLAAHLEYWSTGTDAHLKALYETGQAILCLPPLYVVYRLRRRPAPAADGEQESAPSGSLVSAGGIDRSAA